MPFTSAQARAQLHRVYERMHLEGNAGYRQVSFAEDAFEELLTFLAMVPAARITELIFRLSEGVEPIKIAELYNVLVWSAENQGGVELEDIQEWFYGNQPRRIEVALQVDIFPSNSMQESQRILEQLRKRYRPLRHLIDAAKREVDHRLAEEEAWSQYRRETFEMPKEMTPDIMEMIKRIKR